MIDISANNAHLARPASTSHFAAITLPPHRQRPKVGLLPPTRRTIAATLSCYIDDFADAAITLSLFDVFAPMHYFDMRSPAMIVFLGISRQFHQDWFDARQVDVNSRRNTFSSSSFSVVSRLHGVPYGQHRAASSFSSAHTRSDISFAIRHFQ